MEGHLGFEIQALSFTLTGWRIVGHGYHYGKRQNQDSGLPVLGQSSFLGPLRLPLDFLLRCLNLHSSIYI